MLKLHELNVLRAIGDDIKKRDDLSRSYQCSNFKFNPCTALDLESSIINVLNNFEDSHLIQITKKTRKLDDNVIIMTHTGFYEYLKYSGGVLEIFKPVARQIKNGNLDSEKISQSTNLKRVVVCTILNEWVDSGLIKVLKKEDIEIKVVTTHGDKFIEALLRV